MSTEDNEILSAVRAKLADRIGWQRFQLWFTGQSRLRLSGDRLLVEVGTPFLQDWLRNNFRADVEAAVAEEIATPVVVEFHVVAALAAQTKPAAANNAPQAAPPNGNADASCDSQGATVSLKLPSATATSRPPARRGRRDDAQFDEFVVGAGNRLAHVSAQHCVDSPGEMSPLVLCGPTGIGKTHLLEAIRSAAIAGPRRRNAVYLSAEQFTTHFLEALNGKGLPSFRQKYRSVDILLIDDVQFFVGKRATLIELLYTVDTLLRAGKQLVFAADRPPTELTGLGHELVARLAGGLVCTIQPPDFATRQGLVARLAAQLQVDLPRDVQSLVATHVTSHAREITGALNRIKVTALAQDCPVDRRLAEEALSEWASQQRRVVRLSDIQQAVCEEFGLSSESLQSGVKSHAISYPRMLAMFLARKHTRSALSEIGHFFGRRSHSTVISANKKVEAWMGERRMLQFADDTCHVEDALRRVEARLASG